jgi:hypothetical protein
MLKLVLVFIVIVAYSASAMAGEITLAAGAGLEDVLNEKKSTRGGPNL